MFKFFKEIINSVKEGIAEAEEEFAQEEQAKADAQDNVNVDDRELINEIPYSEKFGTALAAPFRIIAFGDWYTLFKSSDYDDLYPIHLYTFGTYPKLEKHKTDFVKSMKQDFDITDKQSCIERLSSFFDIAGIDKSETILQSITSDSVDSEMWSMNKEGVNAMMCAVLSHITTACTDVGYLDKVESLSILDKVTSFAKKHYSDWETYSDNFLIGEDHVGLNNSAGKHFIKKFIGYLKTKKGSPWNNISWDSTPMD